MIFLLSDLSVLSGYNYNRESYLVFLAAKISNVNHNPKQEPASVQLLTLTFFCDWHSLQLDPCRSCPLQTSVIQDARNTSRKPNWPDTWSCFQ